MEVTCPACAARYSADDDKLRGKTARMRCKACQTAWLVTGPPASMGMPASIPVSVEDPSTERAAVVKTGSERERRDLFAAREPDLGVVNATIPPPSAFQGGVGARNEHSVLFSLDQLTAAGRMKTPPPAQTAAPRATDDEGVIDLKALSTVPPPRVAGGSMAPLFSEPPPMTVEVAETVLVPRVRPTSKGRLIASVLGAVALLGAAGYGLALAFKGEEPVKHAAAMVVEPPKVEVAPPKVDPPKVEAPPPAAVASAAPVEKPPKGKRGKGRKGAAHASPSAASKPAAAAAAPKAADPCGCKGDFNCVLACTAKGSR